VSMWLRHLLRQYRENYGCLPAEGDFCEPPSSADGMPPNTPCILCRLTDAVLREPPDELRWTGEEAGMFSAPVGWDAVATIRDEGGGNWAWRVEDDSGLLIGEGARQTLASAIYAVERTVYEQGLNT
jgi:hypothetical protein